MLRQPQSFIRSSLLFFGISMLQYHAYPARLCRESVRALGAICRIEAVLVDSCFLASGLEGACTPGCFYICMCSGTLMSWQSLLFALPRAVA